MLDLSTDIVFPGGNGVQLAGRLHPALGVPRGFALFAHCFTCSKDTLAAREITGALAQRGITTLRFDFTGLGESAGDFADTHFSSNLDDLVAAAQYLEREHGAPTLLVGHSLGGAAALAVAHRLPSVKAVATVGAPFDPAHVEHLLGEDRGTIERDGEATVQIAGRAFQVRRSLLEDLRGQKSAERIAGLKRALLVMHSPQDNTVGVDNARQIYEHARHPKSFVSLDGADHLLRRRRDARYAADVIATWAERYLPEPEETAPEGEVRVVGGPRGLTHGVVARGHTLNADEPRNVGGGDTGPTPYELLLAGLGSCTAMTLRMYAERKKLPLQGVEVRLKHDRVHAEDCAECEKKTGKVDRIQRRITLHGDLQPEERKRLLEIADRCPVHRTLENEIRIETEETRTAESAG